MMAAERVVQVRQQWKRCVNAEALSGSHARLRGRVYACCTVFRHWFLVPPPDLSYCPALGLTIIVVSRAET